MVNDDACPLKNLKAFQKSLALLLFVAASLLSQVVCAQKSSSLIPNEAAQIAQPTFPPDAPVIRASSFVGSILVFVEFSPADGGSPITQYSATCGAVTGYSINGYTTLLLAPGTYSCTSRAYNAAGASADSVPVTGESLVPLQLLEIYSPKTHGSAGTFSLPIAINAPTNRNVTVEPRAKGDEHRIVFRFNRPPSGYYLAFINNDFSPTVPYIVGNEIVFPLGAIDGGRYDLELYDVDSIGNIDVSVAFLKGDVDGSGTIDSVDARMIKSRSGQLADETNYLQDINLSGVINAIDIASTKSRSGQSVNIR